MTRRMEFSALTEGQIHGQEAEIAALFRAVFTASEGAGEGALVAGLARALLDTTPREDLHVFTMRDKGKLAGAALFTRLRYAQDPRHVVLLSPMAVATECQGQGVGQALIRHALGRLRDAGAEVAITYGDPAFYGKLGFRPLSPGTAPAPRPLSHPEGWIGQSLTGAQLTPLEGACTCAPALDDPAYW